MDSKTDNPQSQTEQAEGSTENVNLPRPDPGLSGGEAPPMERGAGQVSQPEKPLPPTESDDAGGITNRPRSEEEQQDRRPPRGRRKA